MNAAAKRKIRKLCLGFSALFVLYLGFHWCLIMVRLEPWFLRKIRFNMAARRSEPLINAINAYHRDHGIPPEKLKDLVPKYMAHVPETGLIGNPDYSYSRDADFQHTFIWHDLGKTPGIPKTEQNTNSFLAFTLNEKHKVIDSHHLRFQEGSDKTEFFLYQWGKFYGHIETPWKLTESVTIPGATFGDIVQVLGPPSGTRVLSDSPWHLSIFCPQLMIGGLDSFIFDPTQNYSEYRRSSGIERIGKWAYSHEYSPLLTHPPIQLIDRAGCTNSGSPM